MLWWEEISFAKEHLLLLLLTVLSVGLNTSFALRGHLKCSNTPSTSCGDVFPEGMQALRSEERKQEWKEAWSVPILYTVTDLFHWHHFLWSDQKYPSGPMLRVWGCSGDFCFHSIQLKVYCVNDIDNVYLEYHPQYTALVLMSPAASSCPTIFMIFL